MQLGWGHPILSGVHRWMPRDRLQRLSIDATGRYGIDSLSCTDLGPEQLQQRGSSICKPMAILAVLCSARRCSGQGPRASGLGLLTFPHSYSAMAEASALAQGSDTPVGRSCREMPACSPGHHCG